MATTTLTLPERRARTGFLGRPLGEVDGLWGWLTTIDHKRIGLLYGTSAVLFFFLGGIEALIMRLQLITPNGRLVTAETFNQLFTMHGTTMVFLAVMPLSAAFFNYLVPLMIGARDVAFPRLNAFSYWVFILGGIFINLSWVFNLAPDQGWFGYANLTEKPFSSSHAVDFWVLGLQILGMSSLAAAFNFIVTIINLRAPGMRMMRMPVFVWMTLVVSVLLVLAFPPLTVGLTFLLFDRMFGTHFFVPAAGGDPVLWQHVFWIFGHPEVYILILPAMGIVSEVLPTFSRKPLFGHAFVIYSGIAIGFLGFGVWAHHMFAVGMGAMADSVFALGTMLIAVPTGVKIFNWVGTLWGGTLRFRTPMFFAIGFVAMFIIGGLSGVMHASPPVDLQQTDTYFIVAHFHYVLFGGSIFGLFAGIYYWWPKITGRLLDERLGQAHFWLMMTGFNLTFFPMHFLGVQGMPRRIYTYAPGMNWELWNLVATIGSLSIAASFLFFIANVAITARRGRAAGNDPWDGATLEWSISSPPPHYNFATLPQVTSARPLWDEKYGVGHGAHALPTEAAHAPAHDHAPIARAEHDSHNAHAHVPMPDPSYWPLVVAIGLTLLFAGLLLLPNTLTPSFSPQDFWLSAIGLAVMVVGICAWSLEPAMESA
ncbi:MAG: cytochrome c oxidase subunit I [Chloroflexi bacterium]|nr:cytochrome c oxidase subunit I [Chloroflexota bacterium]